MKREHEHNAEDDLLTTAAAGAILDTVPDNVRRMARVGLLQPVAIVGRGQRLFRRADVLRVAEERRIRRG